MRLISPGEAAELVGLTDRTLRNYVRSGRLTLHRNRRGRPRYDLDELLRITGKVEAVEEAAPAGADPGSREELLRDLVALWTCQTRIVESLVEQLR